MPMLSKDCLTRSFSLILSHSPSQIRPSPFLSMSANASWMVPFKQLTVSAAFSSDAASVITSHRTPISMLSNVANVMIKKIMNIHIRNKLEFKISCTVSSRLSAKTPLVNKDKKESPIVANMSGAVSPNSPFCKQPSDGLSPSSSQYGVKGYSSLSSNCAVNKIAKTYITSIRKMKMKPTDVAARIMPLTSVNNSGTKRIKRAMRVRRNNRKSRKGLRAASAEPPPSPDKIRNINGSTHVSITMQKTSKLSNTNQASLRHIHFSRYDKNRIVSSMKK
mmetsp:Transcript_1209/g.2072  ORF Transcript_1209/g.2072 Transcript_1209/m.2072 type:complete len:277 (+) Transcript_1209:913-1743(+)